jgi:low temperature requirement protein LtrA
MLRTGDGRVTQIELFYDLVYVFAVTQLSRYLVEHRDLDGALQTAVLLAMVTTSTRTGRRFALHWWF